MEQWVQVKNERDRQVLIWLRDQVGDAAVISAARSCAPSGEKPYLSGYVGHCASRHPRAWTLRMTRDIGERHLARIYRILQQPGSAAHADSGR